MTGMFNMSDPSEARGNSVTAREILDKASKDMGSGLAKDTEVQSQLMYVMARTYGSWGYTLALTNLQKPPWTLGLSLLGRNDPKTLESMTSMGWILDKEGTKPKRRRWSARRWRASAAFWDPRTRLRCRPRMTWPSSCCMGAITARKRSWSGRR